jgi:lysophosphatidate acyltransferase
LKPIETAHLTASDVEDLARDVREMMLKEHIALTEKALGRPVAMPAKTFKSQTRAVKASGVDGKVI